MELRNMKAKVLNTIMNIECGYCIYNDYLDELKKLLFR